MKMKKAILVVVIVLLVSLVFLIFQSDSSVYTAEIDTTLRSMKKADLTLMVYTDIHHDPSKDEPHVLTEMTDVMAQLWEKGKFDALWNLGDLINGHNTTKVEAIEQIKEVEEAEIKVTKDAHRVAGNHDNNIQATYPSNAGYGPEEVLSSSELNTVLENTATSQTEHHSSLHPTDYYVDFDSIRVVCIAADDTTWTEETAEWLQDEALKTESQVLILAHVPTRPEWGFRNDVVHGELIESELHKFIASGGTIIAYIHGHDHGDMINDTGEWKEVAIGCARFQVPTSNGTEGMTFQDRHRGDATKLLFDVVSVDMEAREVRFARFGAGNDRVIKY